MYEIFSVGCITQGWTMITLKANLMNLKILFIVGKNDYVIDTRTD